MKRLLLTSVLTLTSVLLSYTAIAAQGDVLNSITTINNISGDGRTPSTNGYQGIEYHNGYLWIVDYWSDRIYRVYPEDVYDTDGTTLLFSQGDSDFNLPLIDNATSPICPSGVCGGGSLMHDGNFFWNASPVTDDIIKIDPTDGDNLESENTLTNELHPSPLGMTYDGTHFWIVDWQSNTINRVRPEDGIVINNIDGPSTLPSYKDNPNVTNAQPYGIAWDGYALWVAERSDGKIYRMNPNDGSIMASLDNPSYITVPQGLSWDGQFLWVTSANTTETPTSTSIYQIDTGIIPSGIIGCVEKNGVGVNGEVLLSQNAESDQTANTDGDGCFIFPSFASGVPLAVSVSESGNDKKPVLTLTGGDVTLLVGDDYVEPGVQGLDEEDGALPITSINATPDVLNSPELIITDDPTDPAGITITYTAVDSAGNAADPVTRTVHVLELDIIPPVITLNGDNPMYVEQGSTFTDPGATALDSRDGAISPVNVSGSVDANTAGIYYLDYNVSDAAGNDAATVTRTVNVQDTTKPVITLLGNNPETIEKGDAYIEAGANAVDNIDGALSVNIAGSVSTNLVGTYVLTYNASDLSGNAADTITRTVQVVDTTPPVITLAGATNIDHELQTTFNDPGYSATDAPGEDLTGNVVISGSVDTTTTGIYVLSYNVSDASGNNAITQTRTINVADRTAPVLTITGDNPLQVEFGDTYTELGATANDAVEGNISASVVIGGDTVNDSIPGTYIVTYDVSDSQGNAAPQLTRAVIVGDTTPPTIILNGDAVVQQELNVSYTDAGATANDNTDGDITSDIVVSGLASVDTGTAGDYTITYNVNDAAGNAAAPVTRLVQVGDRTLPTITLLGDNPLQHEVGTIFVDPGATANDNIDGDISGSVTTSGTVNPNIIGQYQITYNVIDSSVNNAIPVVRTVDVVDTGVPTITLLGDDPILHELQTTFTDPGATANDAADGDLTSSIVYGGTVNTALAGTYTLTYDVVDSQSNAAPQVTRDIIVADRTAPTITLNGLSVVTVEQGTSYNDLGATASDIIDGNLDGAIVTSGTVDTNIRGTYFITYNVSDATGNAASEVIRTVNVVDTTAPTISLTGLSTIDHELNIVFVDPGATANDNIDGDISSSVTTTGSVNASALGSYTINYNVSDSAGNAAATETRTVNVVDTGAPTITLIGNNPTLHEQGEAYNDLGATAFDTADGDLGSVTAIGTVDINVPGTYTLTYDISDSQNNPAATVTRDVIVADRTKPVISILGNITENHEQGTTYSDAGSTASDNIDGDISGSVVVTGNVAINSAGTYLLNYNVFDSAGNAADTVVRTVIIADTTPPVITVPGPDPMYVEQGTTFTAPTPTANDNIDNDITSDIVISGETVDPNVAGTYIIRYDVTDAAGNAATSITRTVVVQDTIAPTIALTGNATVNVEQGTSYTELGATATDSVDGDFAAIVGGDAVDAAVAGTYIVTYDATDVAGNTAAKVTRAVVVADTIAPVITLTGASTINVEQGTSYTELGAVANDSVDGSFAATIAGDTVDPNVAGTYTVTYNATDLANNVALEVTRTVIVADTTPPALTLLGAPVVNLEQNIGTYVESEVSASDNIDTLTYANVVVSGDTVDTTTAGNYIIQYDVSDFSGNAAAPVIRTVIVSDTIAPVITVTGTNETLERGAGYTDAGATASDAVDGDLTSNISTVNPVNTLVSGIYTVTYDVSDAAGNDATTAQRSVTIQDTVIPTLTLIGGANINHEQDTPYNDAGATAEDLPGEDISGSINTTGNVTTGVAGEYVLTYRVSDLAGNNALPLTRTVTVLDTTSPLITLNGAATVNVEQGTSYTDAGANASDLVDGTVSVTTVNPVNAGVAGTYTVTYNASDAAGNNAIEVTRTVIVADTTPPTITLYGDTNIDIKVGEQFIEPGVSANDNIDGDLSSSIATSTNFNNTTEGSYFYSYDVSDAGGNAAVQQTRTLNVVNPEVISIDAASTSVLGGDLSVQTGLAGSTGSGYIAYTGEGFIEYTFNAYEFDYDLTVRYSLTTGDRPLEVILNNQSQGPLAFPATGADTTWTDTATMNISPTSGSNTLRLATTLSSGANIDSITITPK